MVLAELSGQAGSSPDVGWKHDPAESGREGSRKGAAVVITPWAIAKGDNSIRGRGTDHHF